jgi:hypothetical protein
MKKFLLPKEWLALPEDTRHLLRRTFSIGKTGIVEVIDNKLVCDGTSQKDLFALDILAMMEFLGEKDADQLFDTLFEKTMKKLCPPKKKEPKSEPATV